MTSLRTNLIGSEDLLLDKNQDYPRRALRTHAYARAWIRCPWLRERERRSDAGRIRTNPPTGRFRDAERAIVGPVTHGIPDVHERRIVFHVGSDSDHAIATDT
jgi:hypothetical protein